MVESNDKIEGYPGRKKTLEEWRLLKRLGDGKFGTAYLAFDKKLKEYVCVKIFKSVDKESKKSFDAEVEAGKSCLVHPNVIKLHCAG